MRASPFALAAAAACGPQKPLMPTFLANLGPEAARIVAHLIRQDALRSFLWRDAEAVDWAEVENFLADAHDLRPSA